MNIETEQALSRAYELIEADRLDEARTILRPILEADKINADAWWLYAHAVTDTETARLALSNVQRIDPYYPDVSELLLTLESQPFDENTRIQATDREPSFLPPLPSTLPGLESTTKSVDESDWDTIQDERDVSLPLWRRPAVLLTVGLMLFLIIAAVVILRPGTQTQVSSTPTDDVSILVDPTFEVSFLTATPADILITSTPDIDVTEQQIEESLSDFASLQTTLTDFDIPPNGIVTTQTSFGSTILVDVCTLPGRQMRETLNQVLNRAAQDAHIFADDYAAIGARMVNCATNTPLLIIAAPITGMVSYSRGDLSQREFEAEWQPVN